MPAKTRRIDSFELCLTPMEAAHIPRLHTLSISVGWPHRPEDWAVAQALGTGVVAEDEIGRLVSSAMIFPVGEGIVNIGMVITSPRLQEQGSARWLMDEMLKRTEGTIRRLNATKAAYRLYMSLGFQPVGAVYQHQGIAHGQALPNDAVRALTTDDHAAVRDLDRGGYGSDRRAVLDHLLGHAHEGTVITRGGRVTGYALCRPFGRGHVLGPVIARTEEDACALIQPLIAAHAGGFLRMDTRTPGGPLQAALQDAGLAFFDTVTTMRLGPAAAPGDLTVFGLATHAFG